MSEKKHGGYRPNSGRKEAARKKKAVFIYVYEDEIETVGGQSATKLIGEQAVARKAKNILNKG